MCRSRPSRLSSPSFPLSWLGACPAARPPAFRWFSVGCSVWGCARRSLHAGRNLSCFVRLEDLLALLARANPDRALDRQDEDLAVADLTRPGVLEDRLRDHADVRARNDDLELHLRTQVDGQLRPSVVLGNALLAPGAS